MTAGRDTARAELEAALQAKHQRLAAVGRTRCPGCGASLTPWLPDVPTMAEDLQPEPVDVDPEPALLPLDSMPPAANG